jgi:hypothetical protein
MEMNVDLQKANLPQTVIDKVDELMAPIQSETFSDQDDPVLDDEY